MTARNVSVFLVLAAVVSGFAFAFVSARRAGSVHPPAPPARTTPANPPPRLTTVARTVKDGLEIALQIGHLDPKRGPADAFREENDVLIGLELRDATSGLPITRARPAAWLVADDEPGGRDDPRKTASLVKALFEARYFTQAKLDFNVYYVLTLNEDSVSVVDPLYGFGGMRLLALVPLGGKGFDWALAEDRNRLFVTVPAANIVVAIDTRSWTVAAKVPTPPGPGRIGLQPGGRSVWVTCEGQGVPKAVGVDVEALRVTGTADVGVGPHDLAFSDDGRFLVIANAGAGTVSIVETARPETAVALRTGRRPTAVAYSALAGQAWVAHAGDGRVVIVDPARQRIASSVPTGLALEHLRFTPDGRRALAVSPSEERVIVLDASNAQPVQQGRVDGGPDRVAFSESFAYIRRRSSPMLRAIPLDGLGYPGRELPGLDIPMGSHSLGQVGEPSPADAIIPVPGGGAVLAVNSGDRSVHYYKEGMSAPMGSFLLRNGEPRAALAVDRSLQERHRPGFYETSARLPEAGDYKLLLYLGNPRVVQTFRLRSEPDPDLARARNEGKYDIAFPDPPSGARVGEALSLRFHVTDRATKSPRADLADLRVQATLVPGSWSDWLSSEPKGEGWYEVRFRPVKAGTYFLLFGSSTAGLSPEATQGHVLHVEARDAG